MIFFMENRLRDNSIDPRHVDVLDGVRALAVLIVMWFHLWQQSWLMPVFSVKAPAFLGGMVTVNLDFIPRAGFIFVDLMLLISGFCLFLPHARTMLLGEPVPDTATFFKKRAARILPSYLLCVLLATFAYSLPTGAFSSPQKFWTDFLSTATFTQVFFPSAFLDSKVNCVLWSVAVEVQFYLLFPLLARWFRKKPLLTYLAMVAVASVFIYGYALPRPNLYRMTTNQLPAFFGVYANGMLAAYLYVLLAKKVKRSAWLSVVATVVAVFSIWAIGMMEKTVTRDSSVQHWQMAYRYAFSLVLCVFLLSAALSARWFRFLFSNRVMRFFAAISYNLYIWHQWIAVRLVEWKIPRWSGTVPPNQAGNRVWQWQFTILVTLLSFLVATVLTYAFEKPIAKKLLAPRAQDIKEAFPSETV